MSRVMGLMMVAMAVAASVFADSNNPTSTMRPDPAAFLRSEKGNQLREALRVADENSRKAEADLPEIKDIDAKLADLTKQMQALRLKRLELLKTAPALAGKRSDVEKARKAMYDEMRKNMPVPAPKS